VRPANGPAAAEIVAIVGVLRPAAKPCSRESCESLAGDTPHRTLHRLTKKIKIIVVTGTLTEHEAREALDAYLDDFREAVLYGFDVWSDDDARGRSRKRTRANRLFDEITSELARRAEKHPNLIVQANEHSFSMSVGSRIVVKVKMLKGEGLRSGGILTNARLRWLSQEATLDGQEVTHLYLGYRLDDLGQTLDAVAITCPTPKRNLWTIMLAPAVAVTSTLFKPEDPMEGATAVRSGLAAGGALRSGGEE
jgi:hypothetical protein